MASTAIFVRRSSSLAVTACALALGCGSSDNTANNAPPTNAGAGGQSAGGAVSAGSGGEPVASAGAPSGGSSGSAAGGMSGAAASGGASGSAGAAGAGMSGAGTGTCAAMGTQADPGTMGDGKTNLDPPYMPAPETTMHLNNAPKGKVNGMDVGSGNPKPLIYAAKTQYPGLSQMLKYEYWIYVPAQYKMGCGAALMVFQDGIHFVGNDDAKVNLPTVMDNLIASGDMPVTIGLFINPGEPGDGHYDGNEYGNRSKQYDTNSPVYSTFLIDEFVPNVVAKDYSIVTDPDGWGTSGHSSGGIAAYITGWYRPDKFRKLLTLDASFPNTGNYMGVSLLSSIDQSPAKPLRVYLMSGPKDLTQDWYTQNTSAATKLAAKMYHYQYRVEQSTHYPPLGAQADIATAMRWMWRGYKI